VWLWSRVLEKVEGGKLGRPVVGGGGCVVGQSLISLFFLFFFFFFLLGLLS